MTKLSARSVVLSGAAAGCFAAGMAGSASAQTQSPAAGACRATAREQTFIRLAGRDSRIGVPVRRQGRCWPLRLDTALSRLARRSTMLPDFSAAARRQAGRRWARAGAGFPQSTGGGRGAFGWASARPRSGRRLWPYTCRVGSRFRAAPAARQCSPTRSAVQRQPRPSRKARAGTCQQIPGRPRGQAGGELCQRGAPGDASLVSGIEQGAGARCVTPAAPALSTPAGAADSAGRTVGRGPPSCRHVRVAFAVKRVSGCVAPTG